MKSTPVLGRGIDRSSGATLRPLILWTVFALLLGSPGFAQEPSPYRITGVVLSEVGGAPVVRGHLTASQTERVRNGRQRVLGDRSDISAETDATGHFNLSVPSAGSWQLYASGRGFREQAYDRHESFFSSVVLTAAAPTYDLVFRLEPESAVTGAVRDEAGEAVRNARVSLYGMTPPEPGLVTGPVAARANTSTDDRGQYEFAGLAPGDYTVSLEAEPWYTRNLSGRALPAANGSSPEPSLDVVYPQTWFPGVTDRRSAEVVSLHHGETRQADFNLTPIRASHLRLSTSPLQGNGSGSGETLPQVERVPPDGQPFLNSALRIDQQGQVDVGTPPGLYRVTLHEGGASETSAFLRVPVGAQPMLDLSAAIPAADLTIHLEVEGPPPRVQVVFTDVETGASFISSDRGGFQRRRHAPTDTNPTASDPKLAIPPGRYRVTLNGDNQIYLAGMSVKQTSTVGRVVTLGSGSTTLNLKLSRGRASLHGTTSVGSKALSGAMVLLVPATFGQAESITVLRRDQTNTDGGFLLENVIPGDYILLAIDNGWTVNWRDPSTLERYLLHGVPVSLAPNGAMKQDLVALSP